jgi:hypothetical protein
MVCAGGPAQNICNGDSGGALVVPVEIGSATGFRLVGDSSFGEASCGGVPSVFGRLGADPIRAALRDGVRQLTGVDIVGTGARPFEPPETAIAKHPRRKVKTRKRRARAKFAFGASEPASFRCGVDGAALAPCSSPLRIKVRRGKDRLIVQAIDALGMADPSPASVKWTVARKGRR